MSNNKSKVSCGSLPMLLGLIWKETSLIESNDCFFREQKKLKLIKWSFCYHWYTKSSAITNEKNICLWNGNMLPIISLKAEDKLEYPILELAQPPSIP